MKFYDREKEIEALNKTLKKAEKSAQFTVLTGRRRVGKTSLLLKAYQDTPTLYFFVARKTESVLCESFTEEISEKLGVPVLGEANSFAKIFEYLMQYSTSKTFTLIIDEFQDFLRVNKSVFSNMQRIWDLYHQKSHINLIVCGSINSMMTKIFKDSKEPLYGRQTEFMKLKPFGTNTIKEILSDCNPNYSNEDLLALYSFTGGVAKYVELLIDNEAFTKEEMINEMIRPDSIFISEGKNILIEEFGRDYATYFSILSCIARGKTTRNEIEQAIGCEISGYLTKLETEYNIIAKKQPLFEKTTTKNVHYSIDDNFFMFWFRFIYRYNYMFEVNGYQHVINLINRDYDVFSGFILERYFRQKFAETGLYTRIGNWWDKKSQNEIDIITMNEIDKTIDFYEVKKKKENIDLNLLRQKSEFFISKSGLDEAYVKNHEGLSMEEM